MDKKQVLGLLLIGGILIAMVMLNTPSEKEIEAQKREHDSIALARTTNDSVSKIQEEANKQTLIAAAEDTVKNQNIIAVIDSTKQFSDSLKTDTLKNQFGIFSGSGTGKDKFYTLENELVRLKISSKGGRIYSVQLKQYRTYDSLPLMMFDEKTAKFGFTFFSDNLHLSTNDLYFKPNWTDNKTKNMDSLSVSGNDSISFAMRLYPDGFSDSSRYMEFLYILKGNSYMVGYKVNFIGTKDIISPVYRGSDYIDLTWEADLKLQEKAINTFNGPTIYYKYQKEDEVDYLNETKDDEEKLTTSVKWISFKQSFFSSTLIAGGSFANSEIKTYSNPVKKEKETHYLRTMHALIGVPFNPNAEKQSISMSFYFGPNKYKTLRQFRLDLERQIPLGWSFAPMAWINRFAVLPVFNYLEGFNLNYGIIILILTVLLKIILFPIAYKTYISSAKMRVLKPEIEEISKKFPKKEDALKKQQATMAFYKKAGVNPMAGCVPMILQIPILIALFRFFPACIELRQQSFLWADDLSSYDAIVSWTTDVPILSYVYGNHVSLFTLLMTISTIIYTRMNNQMMPSNQQMPGMKTMMYLMPIMFLGMFNSYSAALSYYYFLANMFTFGQMYLIRLFVDEDKIHRQIQENKAKPSTKKQSGFQKRLEEMARKRGYKLR